MADAALAAADRSQVLPLYSAAKRGACCGLGGAVYAQWCALTAVAVLALGALGCWLVSSVLARAERACYAPPPALGVLAM